MANEIDEREARIELEHDGVAAADLSDTASDGVVDVTEGRESSPDEVAYPPVEEAHASPRPPLSAALEALLMVSDEPISTLELATFVQEPPDDVEDALQALAASYLEQGRGFELRRLGDGWRYYSAAACAEVVTRFATDGRTTKLTQAALETMAVVAYKQPVSRARIGAIRGVNVDGVMRTLMTRGLVAETDIDAHTGAVLYGTTEFFLERLGLNSLDELPPIADHLPDMSVLDEFIEPLA
ncbi:MAG: SMC-Scp complex subunit ScpB [Actinobacteria bacterium]|nr:SMC-Scp complex subunit ScpB [Actinomycetota bacterium]